MLGAPMPALRRLIKELSLALAFACPPDPEPIPRTLMRFPPILNPFHPDPKPILRDRKFERFKFQKSRRWRGRGKER